MVARWEWGKNHWSLDARLIRALNAEVDVDLGAGFDSATLNPDDGWGWRLDGRWLRALSPRLEVALALFYERQALGKSNAEPLKSGGTRIGSIFQPRIEIKNFGILIGLRQTW